MKRICLTTTETEEKANIDELSNYNGCRSFVVRRSFRIKRDSAIISYLHAINKQYFYPRFIHALPALIVVLRYRDSQRQVTKIIFRDIFLFNTGCTSAE